MGDRAGKTSNKYSQENTYFRFIVFMSKDKNKQRLIEISSSSLNRLINLVYFY